MENFWIGFEKQGIAFLGKAIANPARKMFSAATKTIKPAIQQGAKTVKQINRKHGAGLSGYAKITSLKNVPNRGRPYGLIS